MVTKIKNAFNKQEWAWILYDWANSAFAAIIMAIILPIFFKSIATGAGVSDTNATAYWGYATSFAALICAVLAPILGSIGDYPGYKKRLFSLFASIGIIGTALLAITGSWQAMLVFYIIGTFGFNAANIYYDGFLNDVTTEERMDFVSGAGYGLGYIGGSTIPLIIALLLINFNEKIGISVETATRISFGLTAVWWAVFSIPFLKNVKQTHSVPREKNMLKQSFLRIGSTFKQIAKHKAILWFIVAYFFYIDGVGTIIHMATVFGDSMGIDQMWMMLVLMVVQIVAFPCAIAYSFIAKKIGTRNTILVGVATYFVVCLIGLRLNTEIDFLILGFLVGTAQGGVQALSRSFFGKLVPVEKSVEYFGFFDIFGKFSAVVGPAAFGLLGQITGNTQNGIFAVMAMFIIGGLLLLFKVPANTRRIEG